jgi:hypothetical protein
MVTFGKEVQLGVLVVTSHLMPVQHFIAFGHNGHGVGGHIGSIEG